MTTTTAYSPNVAAACKDLTEIAELRSRLTELLGERDRKLAAAAVEEGLSDSQIAWFLEGRMSIAAVRVATTPARRAARAELAARRASRAEEAS